jgi:hypothetical protein
MPDAPRRPPDPAGAGARRPRGRPRLENGHLNVRLTAAENVRLRALAGEHRLSLSELVRRVMLGRRLPRPMPRVNLEVWARLGPLAGSLNQYVKAVDQGRAGDAPMALLLEIRQLLDLLRDGLRRGMPEDDHETR